MTGRVRASWVDRRRKAGFTLIELLVALTLFSLLSVALFGSISFGMGAWKRGTAHADQFNRNLHVQSLLRRLFEGAYPLFLSNDPTFGHVDFDGTDKSLNFLAPGPIAVGSGGRSRLMLSVEQSESRAELVLKSKLELADGDDTSTLIRESLLTEVAHITFSYFGKTRSGKIAEWHNQWRGETELPQLLRIQVQFPSGDPRVWPELLIARRIDVDVGCTHDPLTNRCRGR